MAAEQKQVRVAMTAEKREAVKQRIEELAQDGRITPEIVVQDARSKASPLHDLFEWDIKKAAREHWIDTARAIITSVKVTITTTTQTVRVVAYVRDPAAGSQEQGYVAISKLRDEEDLAREYLVSAFKSVIGRLTTVKEQAIALGAEEEVAKIIEATNELRMRYQPPAATQ